MRIALFVSVITVAMANSALAADDTVATVNGTKIKKQMIDAATKGGNVSPEQVINELISIELLYQEALKKKLDKTPEVIMQLELAKKNLLANALLRQSDVAKPISDEEMKKVYDDKIKSQNFAEYKARHILITTNEDDAKAIIAELDKGASFEELAKTKSADPGTKEQGGDLGWFNPTQMVPEFSQVVANMSKGTYTRTAVKTRYGWHIIKLEDSRTGTPPTFEQTSKQIGSAIQQKRIQDYIEQLRKTAKIEIKGGNKAEIKTESKADTKADTKADAKSEKKN